MHTKDARNLQVDYKKVDFIKGLENSTEASWNILRWLVKQNYSNIEKRPLLLK